MTTEDDFQSAIDAQPQDWHTRLVFADWLDDRGDPRAAGYRAIAARRLRPLSGTHPGLKREGFWWHGIAPGASPLCHNDISADWFALLPPKDAGNSFWPLHSEKSGVRTRRECDDALARAFAQLPPERQAELLMPVVVAEAPKPRRKKSKAAAPKAKKPAVKKPVAKKKPAAKNPPKRPKG